MLFHLNSMSNRSDAYVERNNSWIFDEFIFDFIFDSSHLEQPIKINTFYK